MQAFSELLSTGQLDVDSSLVLNEARLVHTGDLLVGSSDPYGA